MGVKAIVRSEAPKSSDTRSTLPSGKHKQQDVNTSNGQVVSHIDVNDLVNRHISNVMISAAELHVADLPKQSRAHPMKELIGVFVPESTKQEIRGHLL